MYRVLYFLILLLTCPRLFAEGLVAKSLKVDASFFEKPDPFSTHWASADTLKVQLLPQNIAIPSVSKTSISSLDVKAIHNGERLALLLVWQDVAPSKNVSLDHFSDACAVQFPLKGVDLTSPFMGGKGAPVAILHWKAIWQEDIDHHYQQVTDLYPNTWRDSDRFGKTVAIDAKNPVSQEKRTSPVEELFAEGFGTLTTQKIQNAYGRGVWKDGKWFVVIIRPLATKDPQDPVLEIGKTTSVAFALWEGGNKDVGSRKNYAMWVPLTLEKK